MPRVPAQGWVPRPYQLPLVKHMTRDVRGLRAAIAWHRRSGKDLTCVNIMAIKAFQRKGTYWYVLPYANQARRIIWDGMTEDGRKFIDFFPREAVQRKSEQEMRLHLANGSIIQLVGSDDPDKMVGTNPLGIVFSEYSLSDPAAWQLTNPILRENGGWALFNGTPRGENHFFTLIERAKASKDWFCSHLSVRDTRAIPPSELRKARSELDNEARFQSEYMCSFKTPVEGSYYGPQITKLHEAGRVLDSLPPDPALPVDTAWDLGMDDSTSVWFFQRLRNEIRLVNYYENSGEGLPHYANELNRWANLHSVSFGKHYAPHDVKVRELGSGKSRRETARSLGIRFIPVDKLPLADGIEAVRGTLPLCWFDRRNCHLGLKHLQGYRKEFDSQRGVYRKTPVHDEHSHGADAFRTLALGIRSKKTLDSAKGKGKNEYSRGKLDW